MILSPCRPICADALACPTNADSHSPPSPVTSQVQDFTQAEMLLDMRVVPDPNRLFYSGDTAQTIARGIGFRFAGERGGSNAAG